MRWDGVDPVRLDDHVIAPDAAEYMAPAAAHVTGPLGLHAGTLAEKL